MIALFFWLARRLFDIGRQAIALDRVFAGLVAQGIGIWIGVPGVHQHGREPRRAADQGPDAAADELRRLGIVVNCVALAILLRIDSRTGSSCAEAAHEAHLLVMAAAPAATSSPASRSRARCARAAGA